MWQPVQYLVFKIFCMKFPSKADAELKQKLAAKEVSREYVVRFTVGDSSAELQLDVGKFSFCTLNHLSS
jgi:hypothetical protein